MADISSYPCAIQCTYIINGLNLPWATFYNVGLLNFISRGTKKIIFTFRIRNTGLNWKTQANHIVNWMVASNMRVEIDTGLSIMISLQEQYVSGDNDISIWRQLDITSSQTCIWGTGQPQVSKWHDFLCSEVSHHWNQAPLRPSQFAHLCIFALKG